MEHQVKIEEVNLTEIATGLSIRKYMCGIAGIVDFGNSGNINRNLLGQMAASLSHRGPDQFGVYTGGQAGLGHARLSIIDLTGGCQPMCNEDGTLWIAFNGEIFNYIELRERLLLKGHTFRTGSDTEVIIHLFEDLGPDCLNELNGQFSFAIWNTVKRELFAARDRLGILPFFYTRAGNEFVFASEIKALFQHPGVEREIDTGAVGHVFTFWFPLAPKTMFSGIRELPPAHFLTFSANGNVVVRRYWDMDFSADAEGSEERLSGELLELLTDAVRIRLRADVPVGAYLSGGLDSTVITAIIKSLHSNKLRTFSIAFEDGEFDEREYQARAVDFLGTDHSAVECTSRDIGEIFPDVIWHAEKPVLRTAPAPLYMLSGLARKSGYKVVLTGEGSDEIFGGYDIFKEVKVRQFLNRDPQSRMRPYLLKRLYPYMSRIQAQSPAFLKAFFNPPSDGANDIFQSHMPRWNLTAQLRNFFSDGLKDSLDGQDPYKDLYPLLSPGYNNWDSFSRAQYLESALLLPYYLLSSQGDRMLMANSVEGRFPFLDHRLVEFAGKLPVGMKMKALTEKYLLKQSVRGMIPDTIKKRHKQPYRAPDSKSFFTEKPPDYVEYLLNADTIKKTGYFNPKAVTILADKCKSGRAAGIKDNMALVGILSLQILHNLYILEFAARKTDVPEKIEVYGPA